MALTKLLLYIVVGVLVLGGGMTGCLWYDTKKQVDQMAAMAQMFADVRYGGIHASPLGSAGVNDVRILPHGMSEEIRIEAVRIDAPNIFALLSIKRAFQNGRLPKALHLRVDDLTLFLHGDILAMALANADPVAMTGSMSCGDIDSFGPEEFLAMGYDALKMDFDLGYNFNEQEQQFVIESGFGFEQMMSVAFEMALQVDAPSLAPADLQQAGAKLTRLNISTRDESLNERMTRFCTGHSGMSAAQYIDEQVALFDREMRRQGIALGPGLLAAYRRYLQDADEISVVIEPKFPLNLQELAAYSPEQIRSFLNISVTVNDQPITDLAMTFHEPEPMIREQAQPPAEQTTAITPEAAPEEPPPEKPRYRPVSVTEIDKHLGRMAIIHTEAGGRHQGRLKHIEYDMVKLEKRMRGGTVAYTIRLDNIDKVLILR